MLTALIERGIPTPADARRQTWADAAATLNDHADVWEPDGTDPCRVRICREMANAFRTYAEGVGLPAIDSLREKRRAAEATVARVKALHTESGGWCEACCFSWPCVTIRALTEPTS
jgi:hypothetical protein